MRFCELRLFSLFGYNEANASKPAKRPVSGLKLSRRQLLQLLGSAPLLSAGTVDLALTSSGNAPAKDGSESVIVRRISIPAPGLTLPVVLVRPAEGCHPAVILLDDPTREFAGDEQELRRRCASLAAGGRVLIAPLQMQGHMHDKSACLAAIQRYLGKHPAVVGPPQIVSI